MQIIKISPIGFGANTYAITSDGKNAVVIDPAHTRVAEDLKSRGLTAKFVLLTHCHFDHVGGVALLQRSGAKVLCSDKEKPLVGTYADLFDMTGLVRPTYTIDETLCDKEVREFCGMSVQTFVTPGHTAGGACYLFTDKAGDKRLFTG
ncbi:MAG: MBL fold metallo-hydrolase, partial [Clostridia bacterium]|nr:MBL fold metallo-hydrolase [Clostridia bacterium]